MKEIDKVSRELSFGMSAIHMSHDEEKRMLFGVGNIKVLLL